MFLCLPTLQIQVTFQLVISRPGVPKVAATGFAGRTAVVHVIDDRTELVQSASGMVTAAIQPVVGDSCILSHFMKARAIFKQICTDIEI